MNDRVNEPQAERALRDHQQLVDALLQRALDGGEAPVLIGTGISSVLLVGPFAYKLRKPVKLDFLDFSTLEQRRLDCEAERVLNRRTAPALYLDVVAVRGTVAAPRFAGADAGADDAEGALLDWALRMRRFDPDHCFDRLAAQQRLQPSHTAALGAHLGHFHRALPPSPAALGQPGVVLAWARANFETLCGQPATRPWSSRLDRLRQWTEAGFEALQPRMARRHADGWVREGHGDLHLGNLLWQDGRALAFDAIEFDPSLRHGDVIGDFAFTWMDLHRHGLPGLAAVCLNAYLETLGDWGGLPLLRWYAVYRALVRAKVALLRVMQAQTLGQDPQRDLQALARDIGLAEQLTAAPSRRPCLVAMSGLSGSGKSTASARLVEQLGALRVRSDVERKRLFGLAPEERGGAQLYTADATTRTYARLDALAREGLSAGWPVVVDAACLQRAERDHLRALAAAAAADFVLLSCEAPLDVLRARLHARTAEGRDPSDADAAVLERQLGWHEPVTDDEQPCRLTGL